jgi:RNA polymerase-binding transcription factor DksA
MSKNQKYPFTDEDLQQFQDKIEEQLDRLRSQLDSLNSQKQDLLEGSTDSVDYDDDSKTDQELLKLNGLIENDMNQIQELEAALLRIENKTYGICTETGNFIRKERLLAAPAATTALPVAQAE